MLPVISTRSALWMLVRDVAIGAASFVGGFFSAANDQRRGRGR